MPTTDIPKGTAPEWTPEWVPDWLPAWKKVWRAGFVPQFSDQELAALEDALRTDDKTLLQGATTNPPPLTCCEDWPCEGACGVAYAGWKGRDLKTIRDVEQAFADRCQEADDLLGEPAACRYFLNAFDEWPRDVMRRELLAEVHLEQARRRKEVA